MKPYWIGNQGLRKLSKAGLVAVIAFSGVATGAASTQNPRTVSPALYADSLQPCLPVDAGAEHLRRYVLSILAGTDSGAANDRTIWALPQVDSAEVYFLADSVLCGRAARAHALAEGADVEEAAPVHLLRVGSNRYVAFNFAQLGGWYLYFVFDTTFALRSVPSS